MCVGWFQGGKLIAGWSDEPFRGQLHIKLNGDHRTPDWPLPNGPNQGSKVLGRSLLKGPPLNSGTPNTQKPERKAKRGGIWGVVNVEHR